VAKEYRFMSSQAEVHSIESLKDFRTAMALYSEDTLAALGAVEAEVRRTGRWLQEERPNHWQEQIKRRREQVASAKAEVFRRRLQKTPDYSPSLSEPMEILRRAEAGLQDAERRLLQVRKWQPLFHQAVLEYHGSIQRIKDLAASDVPRAVAALTRMIDALEAYLRIAPPSGLGPGTRPAEARTEPPTVQSTPPELDEIMIKVMGDEPAITAIGEAITEATTAVSPRCGEKQQAQLVVEGDDLDGANCATGS
jgi:hypothetical protein